MKLQRDKGHARSCVMLGEMMDIVIRKLNLAGEETYRWSGRVLVRTETAVTVEAIFTRAARLELGYTTLEHGDHFIEHFFTDRWYNVYEIYAVGTGALRGWYCNITRPAQISEAELVQVDLALDVWVNVDGTSLVLDEEEFAALPLSEAERHAAYAA
ncbi:MAG: DUF402 domain-containing protein, partial [Anaerolineales bacterium]|nr:DUF402 domain-containing protein [Anaerolineales bacterium]